MAKAHKYGRFVPSEAHGPSQLSEHQPLEKKSMEHFTLCSHGLTTFADLGMSASKT
jgi:hypothetical protein